MKKMISYRYGYEIRIVIADNGEVWTKSETRAAPRASNVNGVVGGKWKKVDPYNFKYEGLEGWIKQYEAVESNFRGAPKGIK